MTVERSTEQDDLIALCEQRAAGYGWIARLFRSEVDEELIAGLMTAKYPQGTGNDNIDKGYRKMATYLSNAPHDILLELSVDYVRTFVGHRNDTYGAAYPFESVYTSEKRLLMQEARNEVIAIYREAGMSVGGSWKDPEDHIALELEYMQIMAAKTADALKAGKHDLAIDLLKDQRTFLEDRLRGWTPMLTDDMRRFAKTGLYEGLAYLVDGFLQEDSAFFADVLG